VRGKWTIIGGRPRDCTSGFSIEAGSIGNLFKYDIIVEGGGCTREFPIVAEGSFKSTYDNYNSWKIILFAEDAKDLSTVYTSGED